MAAVRPRLVHLPRARAQLRLRRFVLSMSPQAWATLDVLVVGLATTFAHTVLTLLPSGYGWIANAWVTVVAFCVSIAVSGVVFGLYERKTLLERSRIVVRSLLTLSLGVVLAFACVSLFFYALASRWLVLSVGLAYVLVAVPLRLYAHEVISASRVRLLCVGASESIRKLVGTITRMHNRHFEIVGYARVDDGPMRLVAGRVGAVRARFWTEEELELEEACPCVGNVARIGQILHDYEVDEVVVATELSASPVVGQAVSACLEERRRVTDQTTFVEKLLGEVPAESIATDWFLRADIQNRASYDGIKRVMDVVAALVGLVCALPLWPILALIVRLDSRGPALFKQIRVGQHGKCFTMYKFRTMRQDAEKDGAQWATQNDARVTRVGKFLRQTRLDELPQLLNILRGDMSLVGPRPERPEFVHNLEQILPHYRLRHLIKPGLTGWAQIHYRYGASVADAHRKLCYDLYYLKHRSIDLDINIIIRTVGTFMLGAR